MKKKFDYVLQENTYDCGIASLLTIFNYYDISYNKEKVYSEFKISNQGISAFDLIKISKKYDISAKGVKSLIENIDNDKLPCIAHTINKDGFYHYVVIISKNKEKVKIMDPAYGIIDIDYNEFKNISTNIFIIFDKNKSNYKKDLRFKNFIFDIFKFEKNTLFKIFTLSLFFVLFMIISNYYLKIILDIKNINIIFIISLLFLFIVFIKNIIDYFKNYFSIKLSYDCDKNISKKVISHIISLPYKYYLNKNVGEVVSIINDVENFKDIVIKIFITLSIDSILVFLLLIYISFYNIFYSLLFILFIVFIIFISNKYKYLFNDNYVKLKNSKIKYNSKLIEVISSYDSIKNLHIENDVLNKTLNNYDNVLLDNNKYLKDNNKYRFMYNTFSDIFYIFIVFLSSIILIKFNSEFSDIVLFSGLFNTISIFLADIIDILVMQKLYNTSIKRVLDVLDIPNEKFSNSQLLFINKIDFKNVSYSVGEQKLFSNVNISLKKGDKFFLKGLSGIGKSTLIKLLLKYFDISDGSICIDDININDLDLEFIRNKITYISQNEILFNDSIYNNLSIVCNDKEKIKKACMITGLDKYLFNNNIDLSYYLEEGGSNLSGGERKRIIITRSLLKDSEVLIFDEAFNEIDVDEEEKILKNIIKEYSDKIIIFISHRDNNKNLFNKIYELKGE